LYHKKFEISAIFIKTLKLKLPLEFDCSVETLHIFTYLIKVYTSVPTDAVFLSALTVQSEETLWKKKLMLKNDTTDQKHPDPSPGKTYRTQPSMPCGALKSGVGERSEVKVF
jgi:hypothetical protein